MPTKSVQEIIPDSIDNRPVAEFLEQFSCAIREAVNYSTHVLKWLAEMPGDDRLLPPAMSLRHLIELLDSVSMLVRNGCVEPCKLLLRGVLESSFNVLYILQEETDRRALSFLVWYYNDKLKQIEKMDPNTEGGRQLAATLKKDRLIRDLELPTSERLDEAKSNIRRLLMKPLYEDWSPG
jgi:hypothetical protein